MKFLSDVRFIFSKLILNDVFKIALHICFLKVHLLKLLRTYSLTANVKTV